MLHANYLCESPFKILEQQFRAVYYQYYQMHPAEKDLKFKRKRDYIVERFDIKIMINSLPVKVQNYKIFAKLVHVYYVGIFLPTLVR